MPVDHTEPPSFYPAGPGYVRCLAEMIVLASRSHLTRGFLDHLTGLSTEALTALLMCLARHPAQPWGRLSNAFVGLVDGVCAGMMCLRPDLADRDFPFAPKALADCAQDINLSRDEVQDILKRQRAYAMGLPALAEPVRPGTYLLEYLAVRRENRGRGVGAGLLRRALHEAAKAGGAEVVLYVDMGNERALSFYHGFGFRRQAAYPFGPDMAPYGPGVLRLGKDIGPDDLETTRDWKEIFVLPPKGA